VDDRAAYVEIADAVAEFGMAARGGFAVDPGDDLLALGDAPARSVVIGGNIGAAMWPHFRRGERSGADPLDDWTRAVLGPLAERWGARFIHPSDQPYQPFQRWAQRADDVWQSPIGLLVHADHGLWHAYRGAFVFPFLVDGLPHSGGAMSPCLTCADQPCLTTCPVDAFTEAGYDAASCATHVRSDDEPRCLEHGCAARLACPVGVDARYGPDQMRFHMRAFVGADR
jgi:hypothetical protein